MANGNNGTVAGTTVTPTNRVELGKLSKFTRGVKKANDQCEKKKWNAVYKSEEGKIGVQVAGRLCTDLGELINQSRLEGAKIAVKSEVGFGVLEGSGGGVMKGEDAAAYIAWLAADESKTAAAE